MKNSKPTIYYAHHIWKYGTKIEEWELELIREKYPNAKIINPATDIHQPNKEYDGKIYSFSEADTMRECLECVRNSDILVFSSLSGCVGRGVVDEVQEALSHQKTIEYIFEGKLCPMDTVQFKMTDKSNCIYAVVEATA